MTPCCVEEQRALQRRTRDGWGSCAGIRAVRGTLGERCIRRFFSAIVRSLHSLTVMGCPPSC